VDRRGGFINILPPGTLRTNGSKFNFAVWDLQSAG